MIEEQLIPFLIDNTFKEIKDKEKAKRKTMELQINQQKQMIDEAIKKRFLNEIQVMQKGQVKSRLASIFDEFTTENEKVQIQD